MLKQILEQNPSDSFARYGLAMELASRGEVENALAEFQKLRNANPDYVPAYQMAAQTLLDAGRSAEACAMLEEGIACAQRTGNQHAASEMQGMLDSL